MCIVTIRNENKIAVSASNLTISRKNKDPALKALCDNPAIII